MVNNNKRVTIDNIYDYIDSKLEEVRTMDVTKPMIMKWGVYNDNRTIRKERD